MTAAQDPNEVVNPTPDPATVGAGAQQEGQPEQPEQTPGQPVDEDGNPVDEPAPDENA